MQKYATAVEKIYMWFIYLFKLLCSCVNLNKASQAIQSPRTVPFFLLVSLLDGYSFPNALVKGIVAFEHLKKTATLTSITDL